MTSTTATTVTALPHGRVPFGEIQGYANGVPAYSNGSDNHFSGHRNIQDGHVFTGFRWQCVEFGRRWLLAKKGLLLGDAMFAAHIFEYTEVEDVTTGEPVPMTPVKNGGFDRPVADCFIIYPQTAEAQVGHIAVITGVFDDHITIADQNQHFHKWEGNYSAKLPLRVEEVDVEEIDPITKATTTTKKTRYTIINEYDIENPLGWLTFPAKYDNCRPDPSAHLDWHPSYKPADYDDCSMSKLNACVSKSVCPSAKDSGSPHIYQCPASLQTTREIFEKLLNTVLNAELGPDDGEDAKRALEYRKVAWKAFFSYYFTKSGDDDPLEASSSSPERRGDSKRSRDALFLFSGLVERHLIEDGAPGKKGSGGSTSTTHHATGTDAAVTDGCSGADTSEPLSPTVFASTPAQVVPVFLGEVVDGVVEEHGFVAPTPEEESQQERRVDNRLSFYHTNIEGLFCTNRAAGSLHQVFVKATGAVMADDAKLKDVSAGIAPTTNDIASGENGPSNFAEIPEELWPLLRKSFFDTHTTAFLQHNLTTLFAGYFELTIASRTETGTPILSDVDPTDNAYGKKCFLQLQGGRYFLDSPEGIFELDALHNTYYDEVLLETSKERQTAIRYIKNHKKNKKKKVVVGGGDGEGVDDGDEEGVQGSSKDMKDLGNKGLERRKRQQEERQQQRLLAAADGGDGDAASSSPPASPLSPVVGDDGEPEGILMSGTTFLGRALLRAWRETIKASALLYGTAPLPPTKDAIMAEMDRPLVHIFVGTDTIGEVHYRSLHMVACAVEAGARAKLCRTLDDFTIVDYTNTTSPMAKVLDTDGEEVRILWKACRWDDAVRDYSLWKQQYQQHGSENINTNVPRLCELLLGVGGRFGVPSSADSITEMLSSARRASMSGVFVVDPFWVSITGRSSMFKYAFQADPLHFAFQGLDPTTGFSTSEGAPLVSIGEVNAVLQCWVVASEAGGVTGCEKKVIPRTVEEMQDMGLPEDGDADATVVLGIGAVKTQRIMYPMRFVHD